MTTTTFLTLVHSSFSLPISFWDCQILQNRCLLEAQMAWKTFQLIQSSWLPLHSTFSFWCRLLSNASSTWELTQNSDFRLNLLSKLLKMSNISIFSCSFGLQLLQFTPRFLDQEIARQLVMSGEDIQELTTISKSGCRLGKILSVTSKTQLTTTGAQLLQTTHLSFPRARIQTTWSISTIINSLAKTSLRTSIQDPPYSKTTRPSSWFTPFTFSGFWIRFSSSLFCLISWLLLSLNLTRRLWTPRFNCSTTREASSTTSSKSWWAVLVFWRRDAIASCSPPTLKKATEETSGLVSCKTWRKRLVNKQVRSTITSRTSLSASLSIKKMLRSKWLKTKQITSETSRNLRRWPLISLSWFAVRNRL